MLPHKFNQKHKTMEAVTLIAILAFAFGAIAGFISGKFYQYLTKEV